MLEKFLTKLNQDVKKHPEKSQMFRNNNAKSERGENYFFFEMTFLAQQK